jgi:hypothetical protein
VDTSTFLYPYGVDSGDVDVNPKKSVREFTSKIKLENFAVFFVNCRSISVA